MEAKPSPFTADMIALMVDGELPEGRALDICRSIYAEWQARTATGKTRGTHFKAAKETGREQATQWFFEAKAILASLLRSRARQVAARCWCDTGCWG